MKWDHVRVFLAVARLNRLSTAGKHLSLDTSTVGRHIDQLEADLQTRLFDRSPQGYALTVDGKRLVPLAEGMESTALQISDQIVDETNGIQGAIRIGAPEGISNYVLSDIAVDFCEEYPKAELQLIAMPRVFSLSKREADIAITITPPQSGRLRIQKVADYSLYMYTTDKATERFGEITNIENLKRIRGIGYIPDLIHDDALHYIPEISPHITPHLTSSSLLLQTKWALSGAGVCILPKFLAVDHPELRPILQQDIHFRRSFYMLQHQDMSGILRVKRTVEFFVERMRQKLRQIEEINEGS
ncbi:MAG: LysR family transcriptional regulator [Hyphomicrobiales bacterium]